jgi:2-iminobutanoate/2-iminopropanoate deaminase
MAKTIVQTPNAPAPIGPYSQAVKANGFLFVSGQVAIDPATGNVEAKDVVKTTIFLSDMSLFAQVNEVYATYLDGAFPARETVAVKGLPKNVNVEISMIATA